MLTRLSKLNFLISQYTQVSLRKLRELFIKCIHSLHLLIQTKHGNHSRVLCAMQIYTSMRKADFLQSNQTSDSEDSDLDDEDTSECMKMYMLWFKFFLSLKF